MSALNPYLIFNGNTEEAFNFYKSVFGGEFTAVMRNNEMPAEYQKPGSTDGDKIMHISLPVGSSVLMASDSPESMEKAVTGNNFSISISVDSKEEADRVHKGLSEGGKVTMPMADAFWGSYFGMLTDKYGVNWMVSYDKQPS